MRDIFDYNDRSRLFPLFWLKGEDERALREGVRKVSEANCGALVAESRTHPDFLGPAWWRDIGIILDECEKRNMDLWVMDDQHFPSGYAAGRATGTPYCRMMMTELHMDVRGPVKGGSFVVKGDDISFQPGEGIVAVIAARRLTESNRLDAFVDIGGYKLGECVDLTETVSDGMAYWDVPEGIWRVFVLRARYVSERVPPRCFVNPLLPEGGQLMLDTVYRPHFEHFGHSFGKTFKGFFSDEPALRAGRGYHAVLGEYPALPIPWRTDMLDILRSALGRDARTLLPGLWYDIGEDTARVRYALMNTVSRLYGENYSMPIGDWCREHGAQYIGHVIEQNNTHYRLGSGAGHFYRAIGGQDMAGIDIVLHELRPELRGGTHAWSSQDFEADDDFFRFMLAQMAVSSAHIDIKKQGRTMCEVFGAYGWQEDISEMRYLANLLLSRGVNYFSPHAFTLAPYPDSDSPPHFDDAYHPQMPFITRLFDYMARLGGMIDGGKHISRTSVLYNAEAEWANGTSGCMKAQDIVKVLNDCQIECEIVPIDLLDSAEFDLLLIPRALSWPGKLLELCSRLRARGKRVYFINDFPKALSEGEGNLTELLEGFEVLPLELAAETAQREAPLHYHSCSREPRVHLYPYEKNGEMIFLLFNEDTRGDVEYSFFVRDHRQAYCIDHECFICRPANIRRTGGGQIISLRLEPGQLLTVLLTGEVIKLTEAGFSELNGFTELDGLEYDGDIVFDVEWEISLKAIGEKEFIHYTRTKELFDITSPAHCPRFSGTVRYTAEAVLPKDCAGVRLHSCAGAVRVWLDEKEIGVRIAPPYLFSFIPVESGRHRFVFEVTNSPVFKYRDHLSFFACIPPTGIQGSVKLLLKRSN